MAFSSHHISGNRCLYKTSFQPGWAHLRDLLSDRRLLQHSTPPFSVDCCQFYVAPQLGTVLHLDLLLAPQLLAPYLDIG